MVDFKKLAAAKRKAAEDAYKTATHATSTDPDELNPDLDAEQEPEPVVPPAPEEPEESERPSLSPAHVAALFSVLLGYDGSNTPVSPAVRIHMDAVFGRGVPSASEIESVLITIGEENPNSRRNRAALRGKKTIKFLQRFSEYLQDVAASIDYEMNQINVSTTIDNLDPKKRRFGE